VAWTLIAVVVLGVLRLFAPPGASPSFVSDFIVIALAVFVLVTKRRERRPDFVAVFDD
jgi:hypothetical protein